MLAVLRVVENSALIDLTLWLRARVREHNRHALFLAAMSLLLSAALWAVLYFIARWLTLLGVSVVAGVEGRDAALPAHFTLSFAAGAGALLLLAALRRALTKNDAPRDRKTFDEHFADFVLTPPATTLAIWGNLSAWQCLDAHELRGAARLLEAIITDKRLPLSSAPLIIRHDARRERLTLALMLIGVVDLRHEGEVQYLRLSHTVEPEFLLSEKP